MKNPLGRENASVSAEYETEIKIQVATLAPLRARLRRRGALLLAPRALEDNIVLDDNESRLRRGRQLLRLRQYGRRCLLTHKGPAQFDGEIKQRLETEVEIADFAQALLILTALGFQTVARYQKRREIWQHGECHVFLDETPIGAFVEIEGEHHAIEEARAELEIAGPGLTDSYLSLYAKHRAANPDAPEFMLFPESDTELPA